MSTLEEILNTRAKDIEPPKALPSGTYLGIVDGMFERIESREKKTPGYRFRAKLIRPIEVADEQGLADAGGCEGKSVSIDFYVTENNKYFIKQFLVEHLGIEEGEKTILELMSESPGRQVGVVLRQQLSRGTEPRMIHVLAGTVRV
ncbi:MAG TPA: hypothetical protein VH187_05405 [Scandinavium sp.]|jgi:hypothetical protein|uniref:hypothetical protein n=1 Tax=Scandinavium sp. TaxID=2830653 RepID=UPI002E323F5C|nr:hypothetical protein [Scandinavium sp.]HEX4500597.1 hypothetical protein [Scandinavium sp.]